MQFSISVEGMEDLERRLANAPNVFSAAMLHGMRRGTDIASGEVKKRTPIGVSGELASTITSKVERHSKEVIGIISTPKRYAPPVEVGGRPHWAPMEPLMYWVRRTAGATGRDLFAMAIGLQLHIAIFGTPAVHMFGETIEEEGTKIGATVADGIMDYVRRHL